ncbi:secreted protein [Rhodopirellula maiorica SM1]|uniref:Secreted protein n=1 Tax=Rhodopirellula maiorica SM1 TaxID=1265738 RepID=M5RRN9_9BACT|nr:Lpg1974 family pore-forming outer membrane protein [Rhodopirellula maiorica]EMI18052.1 secreted protein [Rhodopirellula maiorica SM1]
MKRNWIGTQAVRALTTLVAALPLTAVNALDGVSPGFANQLERGSEGQWQGQYAGDPDYLPPEYETPVHGGAAYDGPVFDEPVYNPSEYSPHSTHRHAGHCSSCDAPSGQCGCKSDHGDGIFAKLHKMKQQRDCHIDPWWAHRTSLFGEFLWLRPGSTDLIYATEQTDPDPAVASPTGPLGIVGLDAEAGFRVGGSLGLSQCSSIQLSYARWDGSSQSSIAAQQNNVLASNVTHPSVATSGNSSLEAFASQEMNFQTVDLNYRHLWKQTDSIAVNWLAGVRYGNIEQKFSADQTVSVATGLTNVATDIDFDGFGISGGLDFETYSCKTGLMLYGKTMASLMAGEWNATYDQRNQFGGGVISNRYEDFHATPTLDAELGVRWMGHKRHLVLSSGFLMSAWYESVTTRSYIDSVRDGQLTDAGETMTFSGLTARAEWRF